MPLVNVGIAVIALLVLMVPLRVNGFIALIIVSVFVGVLQGLPIDKIYDSITDGIGSQLDDLAMILGFGAMLGKVMADTGAAEQIATSLVKIFGVSRVQVAMVLTSIAIGITMFFEVGFILLIPIVYTIVEENDLPLLWVGLPMSITLSTLHSFLPPHPGPSAVASTFHASLGLTLLYGLVVAVPAASAIAFLWPRWGLVKAMRPTLPTELITSREQRTGRLPGFAASLFVALIPVVLMGAAAAAQLWVSPNNGAYKYLAFFGEGPIALLIGLLAGLLILGLRSGRSLQELNRSCGEAVKPIAIILLVIAGGGALSKVLVNSGTADYITHLTHGWGVSPIILGWAIAALLRVALGSATVAIVTAAGVVAPLVAGSSVSPELMVLAVSSGSIVASHVNDPGFWLFKEFLNLSVVETIKVRTTYTTVLGLIGLGGVLLEHVIF